MTFRAIVAVAVLVTACSSAPTSKPVGPTWKYPSQRISVAEWQALKAETLALPGAKVEESDFSTKVTITAPSGQLTDTVMYMFTTPAQGNTGHPAAAKIIFPLNSKGEPTPDYAFHYAGDEGGFKAFVRGVIIGASLLATQPAK